MAASIAQLDNTCRFASELGVRVSSDMVSSWPLQPILPQIDWRHGGVRHITDGNGMDYYSTQITYLTGPYLKAIRPITVVMPGYHSKLAYTLEGSEPQQIRIHKGLGYLILGSPASGDNVEAISETESFRLDPKVNESVTIPAGRFYTFESSLGSDCPLVVSSLYRELKMREVEFAPGTEELTVEGQKVTVPDEFYSADFN